MARPHPRSSYEAYGPLRYHKEKSILGPYLGPAMTYLQWRGQLGGHRPVGSKVMSLDRKLGNAIGLQVGRKNTPPLSKEMLDADLDKWRLKDKKEGARALDKDMDDYWAAKDRGGPKRTPATDTLVEEECAAK